MRDVLRYLSGEVPGGILLLFFLLLVINLALFYLYHSSRLFTREDYKRKMIRSNVLLLGIYIVLWFVLKPPALPDRVLILPFQEGDGPNYPVAEAIQQKLEGNLNEKYYLHRWQWVYETANKDSFRLQTYREELAVKLGAAFIISGDIRRNDPGILVNLRMLSGKKWDNRSFEAENYDDAATQIVSRINKNIKMLRKNPAPKASVSDKTLTAITEAELEVYRKDYDRVIADYARNDSVTLLPVCSAYLYRGIAALENEKSSPLVEEKIYPDFRRLLNLLIPYSKTGRDTAPMNIILSRMYLHVENYEMAEVCLERALSQQRYNSRVYYYISFLHESRYRELGFRTRSDVLRRAVQLDPGYANAVYDWANQVYISGTAAATHPNTEKAINILHNFLRVNPNNENVLSLLGRIYLQSKFTLEAIDIYNRLVTLLPQSAENHYNLGIGLFHKQDYTKAKEQFNRALQINDYADAYLYLGAIERLAGNRDKALYYYRERVKRKSGEDDQYAKQAMRGIRLILNEIAEEEEIPKNENRSSGD